MCRYLKLLSAIRTTSQSKLLVLRTWRPFRINSLWRCWVVMESDFVFCWIFFISSDGLDFSKSCWSFCSFIFIFQRKEKKIQGVYSFFLPLRPILFLFFYCIQTFKPSCWTRGFLSLCKITICIVVLFNFRLSGIRQNRLEDIKQNKTKNTKIRW